MSNVTISQEAYDEFKKFLDENKVESYNIRIKIAGLSCHGPVFDIEVGEKKDDEIVEQVNDINFIMKKDYVDEFGGFIILSTKENDGRGLALIPVIAPAGNCGSCGGCH